MKQILALALAASLAPGAAVAATVDRQAALDSMVAAEKAFAQMAAEKGTREAFLAYLAEDSVLFAPDPKPGREVWTRRPVTPALLSWYPTFAEVSLAGDLGYDTGPWERRAKGKDDPEVAYGDFVTVWRKEADGTWKVAFDQGIGHPKPAAPAAVAIAPAKPAKIDASAVPSVDFAAAQAALFAADRSFAKAAEEKGEAGAYPAFLAEGARLYREGSQPTVDRAALSGNTAALTWEPAGGGLAHSGDLGYTYGIAQRREGGKDGPWVPSENYFRVWKKQPTGDWKVVLDVLNPRPKPAPVAKKETGGGS
jgi:ketosteroid isomerase-like protein